MGDFTIGTKAVLTQSGGAEAVLASTVTGGGGLSRRVRNENLIIKYVTAATVDIDADYLTVFDTNDVARILSSVNLTATLSASNGINLLDTGSEASSTWYHLYVIYNGTTVASLLSTSITAPTMPSGYTYKKYVGAVRNDSSSNFVNFNQVGNSVATKNEEVNSDTSSDSTWASISLSAHVPPNATAVIGNVYTNLSSSNSGYSYLCSALNGGTALADGMGQQYTRVYTGDSTSSIWTPFRIPIIVPSTIYSYNQSTSNVTNRSGWEYQGLMNY